MAEIGCGSPILAKGNHLKPHTLKQTAGLFREIACGRGGPYAPKKVSTGTRQRRRWKCLEDARSDAR
jgi:hypothetical protein